MPQLLSTQRGTQIVASHAQKVTPKPVPPTLVSLPSPPSPSEEAEGLETSVESDKKLPCRFRAVASSSASAIPSSILAAFLSLCQLQTFKPSLSKEAALSSSVSGEKEAVGAAKWYSATEV